MAYDPLPDLLKADAELTKAETEIAAAKAALTNADTAVAAAQAAVDAAQAGLAAGSGGGSGGTTPPGGGTTPPPATGTFIIGDDFPYADDAAFQAVTGVINGVKQFYNDGVNFSSRMGHKNLLAKVDKAKQFRGHGTLRLDFPANSALSAQLKPALPSELDPRTSPIWLNILTQFKPGFNLTGMVDETNVGDSYKLFGVGLSTDGGAYGSGRAELIVDKVAINLNRNYGLEKYPNGGATDSVRSTLPFTPMFSDGAWYEWAMCVDCPAGAEIRNRVWRRKVDASGNQLDAWVLFATVHDQVSGTTPYPRIITALLGMNFNELREQQAMTLWLGEWSVRTGLNPFSIPSV